MELLDAHNYIRGLQSQLEQNLVHSKDLQEKLSKKHAQLDLAHTAVNDLQNKLNQSRSELRYA